MAIEQQDLYKVAVGGEVARQIPKVDFLQFTIVNMSLRVGFRAVRALQNVCARPAARPVASTRRCLHASSASNGTSPLPGSKILLNAQIQRQRHPSPNPRLRIPPSQNTPRRRKPFTHTAPISHNVFLNSSNSSPF